MKKQAFWLLALFLTVSGGCVSNDVTAPGAGAEGTLTINLASSDDLEYISGQKGDVLFDLPNPGDFKILIFNDEDVQYASFAKLSEMPSPARLRAGNYTLKASHGANPPAAFNAPYFEGVVPFTITGTGNTDLQVSCKVANVLLSVRYSDKFKEVFDNYSLDVMTEYTVNEEGKYEALTFIGDDTRIGYLRVAPKIYLSISVHKIDSDKTYRYGATPIEGVVGGEYYKVTFDSDARGNAVITVTANDATESREVDILLGEDCLAKDEPYISSIYDSADTYSMFYRSIYDRLLNAVYVQGGMQAFTLDVDSDYAAEVGIPTSVDLLSMDITTSAALSSVGIVCSPVFAGKDNATIDFTRFFNELPVDMCSYESQHIFTLNVTDIYGRTESKTLDFVVKPLWINFNPVADGEAWGKRVYFEPAEVFYASAEDIASLGLKYQFSKDGVNWTDGIAAEYNSERWYMTGLQPLTSYQVRAMVGRQASEAYSIVTEAAPAIPNGSFEDYHSVTYATKYSQSSRLFPYVKDETAPFWETLNRMTTKDNSDNYCKSFPCVTASTDASDGYTALRIQTIGWGPSSSAGTVLGVSSSPQYITPGKLFVGDYVAATTDYNNGIPNIKQGKPFPARPVSVSFDYKYAASSTSKGGTMSVKASIERRDGDVVTVLATGTFSYNSKASPYDFKAGTFTAGTAYTTVTMLLTYTDIATEATHISLLFQSNNDGELAKGDMKALDTDEGTIIISTDDRKIMGCTLLLDNVVLNY